MSCCGSCAHGRKCEGKKKNPLTKAEVKRIRGLAAAALHGFRRKRGTHLGSVRRGAAFAYLNVLTHVGGRAAAGKAQASLARLARRANPNFLFLAKNGKHKRRNPEASNNWIYQPNGRKRRLPARSRSGRFKKGRR